MAEKQKNGTDSLVIENYIIAIVISLILFGTVGHIVYAVLKNILGFNDDYSGLIAIGICVFAVYKMFIRDKNVDNEVTNHTSEKYNTEPTVSKVNNKSSNKKQRQTTGSTLTENQRNQKDLDRYVNANHSKEDIGLFYERYIGYIFESKGWHVIYHGAKKGKEDEGIDLICIKNDRVRLVQCKYWSQNKTLFENSIFQLYGTWQLRVKRNDFAPKKIDAYLITSTVLSEFAKSSAETLGINFKQSFKLNKNYPKIKCTTTKEGEKIYHLPTDQQYDNIGINKDSRRFYVLTVADAVAKGHRRAYRHRFSD